MEAVLLGTIIAIGVVVGLLGNRLIDRLVRRIDESTRERTLVPRLRRSLDTKDHEAAVRILNLGKHRSTSSRVIAYGEKK